MATRKKIGSAESSGLKHSTVHGFIKTHAPKTARKRVARGDLTPTMRLSHGKPTGKQGTGKRTSKKAVIK